MYTEINRIPRWKQRQNSHYKKIVDFMDARDQYACSKKNNFLGT